MHGKLLKTGFVQDKHTATTANENPKQLQQALGAKPAKVYLER